MNREEIFLKIIGDTLGDNKYIGDDCAYLKEFDLLVSQDTFVEGVHFSTDYFTPSQIAKKALLANISDILSGGGKPLYITLSLSGNLDENFVENFYKGLNETLNQYNIRILGGDLTGGDKITVSVCIMGKPLSQNIPKRSRAKEGYSVYLIGEHGSSAQGLKYLLEGNRDFNNEFIKAHIEPVLYPKLQAQIASRVKNPYSMTDTSDGLYDALCKISQMSDVGFKIEYDKIIKKTDNKDLVLFGGEDFGLLICVCEEDSRILDELNVQKIGIVTKKDILIDGMNLEDKRFNHF